MQPTPPTDGPATQNELKLNRKVDRSLLISLVAVAISLIGTVVSIYEARVLRDQQNLQLEQKSASAWPYVAVSPYITLKGDTSAVIDIKVSNRGVGPAIIGDVHYYLREGDRRLEVESYSVMDSFQLRYPQLRMLTTRNLQLDSLVLPPGETVSTFIIRVDGFRDTLNPQMVMNELANHASVEFCYCSVYGDCWYRGGGYAPSKNPDCQSYIDY